MPSHDTVIDMAGTIILLRQIVDEKVQRIEYLEGELERMRKEESQDHEHSEAHGYHEHQT